MSILSTCTSWPFDKKPAINGPTERFRERPLMGTRGGAIFKGISSETRDRDVATEWQRLRGHRFGEVGTTRKVDVRCLHGCRRSAASRFPTGPSVLAAFGHNEVDPIVGQLPTEN
jgi:hypothetical protein